MFFWQSFKPKNNPNDAPVDIVFGNWYFYSMENISERANHAMTIAELRNKYTEAEISSIPGDNALRFAAFAPLFQNLHNNLLVYRESRFYAIVAVTNLELLPQRLSGQARVFKKIERMHRDPIYPERTWRFSCSWGNLRLCNRGINAPQISFTVWPEPALVAEVERLVDAGKGDEAYECLYKEF